jgi:hypothetical protein
MEKIDDERRETFVETLCRTGSKRVAIQVTAEKFGVSPEAVKMDWSRRASWPLTIFKKINSPVFTYLFTLEIREGLNQIEKLIRNTENSNCKLGAIRTKVDTLFKLVNLQRADSLENIQERMEMLEKRLDILTKGTKINQKEDRNDGNT